MFIKKSKQKFKRITSWLVLANVILLVGCSPKSPEIKETQETTTTTEEFKVTTVDWPYYEIKKDKQVVGHLLGTMHIGVKEMYPFPAELLTDLTSSDLVITEVPMKELVEPDMNMLMTAITATEPITTNMTKATKKLYLKRLKEYGFAEKDFESFNRLGVEQMLQSKFTSPIATRYGVEMKLYSHMKEQENLKNIGFETTMEQLDILLRVYEDSGDINEWVNEIPSLKEGKASYNELIKTYVEGNIFDYIEEDADSDMSQEQKKIMLDQRNENWMKQLPDYLETNQHVFVAVGAGHLPRDKGLLTLLKEAGYDTQKVTFK